MATTFLIWQAVRQEAYAPLWRHRFSAAAILTLQAPDREKNRYDLRVYRQRWHGLVGNCSVRSAESYAIGQRLGPNVAAEIEGRSGMAWVDLRGEPGDLYVFNSEHVSLCNFWCKSRVLSVRRDRRWQIAQPQHEAHGQAL